MVGHMISDYHKAVVGAVAAGLLAAIGVVTGAMTTEDTFGDIPTVTWLVALGAFITGSGLAGGTIAVSKANTIKGVAVKVADRQQEVVINRTVDSPDRSQVDPRWRDLEP